MNKKFGYLKKYKGKLLGWFVFRQMQEILTLIEPFLYLLFLEHVLTRKNIEMLSVLIGCYIGIFVLKTFVSAIGKKISYSMFPQMACDLREDIMQKYISMNFIELRKNTIGEWKEIIHNDTQKSVEYIEQSLEFVCALVKIIISAIFLIYLNRILAFICFAALPLSFIFTKHMKSRGNTEYEKQRQLRGKYNDFMMHNIYMWKEIRSGCLENMQKEQFLQQWKELGNAFLKAHMYWFVNRTFLAFKDIFMTRMGLYLLGGILVMKGITRTSILLSFMEYYVDFINSILMAIDIIMRREEQKVSLERVNKLLSLDTPKEEKQLEGQKKFETLQINNLSFRYVEKVPIIKSVSFTLNKGEHLAITGESGCGKSTLLDLLLGIQYPDSGYILWDQEPVNEIPCQILYEKVGAVLQDSTLFNMSIRENLLLGNLNASDAELWTVCRLVNIDSFIMKLPEGMDTVIGERGIKLSGGEKQRLLFARLLLSNPEVILLDEPTSSLDYENEKKIMETVMGILRGKTLIIVSHQNTLIDHCDKMILMD